MQLLKKKLSCYNLFIRNSKILQYVMGVRQKLVNEYLSPHMGNCGILLKAEPSIVYPTSQVSSQKFRFEQKK